MENKRRLIDVDKLIERLTNWKLDCLDCSDFETANVIDDCMCELDAQPTVDAVEVVHGRWKKFNLGRDDFALRLKCSSCSHTVYERDFNYCPMCGAKMDGDENA